MKKSLFMLDSSRSNYGYEAMLDFQISWLLRIAKEHPSKTKPELHKVARKVLFKLIDKEDRPEYRITQVEVWKQWERIDVIAAIELEVNNLTERHLVVIEDKAYTLIHDDQLTRYEHAVNSYYRNKTYEKHFWVISFFDRDEKCFKDLMAQCEKTVWEPLSFYEVIGWKDGKFSDTESDLFNEFWLREWY